MVNEERKGKDMLNNLAQMIDSKIKTNIIKTNIATAFSNLAKKNKEKRLHEVTNDVELHGNEIKKQIF